VIYVGSFNKILFPGLRVAYALVPEPLVGAFVDAKHAADGHTALLSQGVLAAFISEGHLAHHLRTTRDIYNERRRQPARREELRSTRCRSTGQPAAVDWFSVLPVHRVRRRGNA